MKSSLPDTAFLLLLGILYILYYGRKYSLFLHTEVNFYQNNMAASLIKRTSRNIIAYIFCVVKIEI